MCQPYAIDLDSCTVFIYTFFLFHAPEVEPLVYYKIDIYLQIEDLASLLFIPGLYLETPHQHPWDAVHFPPSHLTPNLFPTVFHTWMTEDGPPAPLTMILLCALTFFLIRYHFCKNRNLKIFHTIMLSHPMDYCYMTLPRDHDQII